MPSFVVNGALTLSGDPTAPNQVATKGYVDSKVTNMDASHVGGVVPLAGARMPALSGDLIANQGNTTLTLAPTGVVAGSYTKVRTDANGRIVEGVSTVVDDYSAYISFTNILPVSRPNSLAGYGITEAVRTDGTTMTDVLSLGSSSFAATELVTKGYVDASRDTALYGKTISAGDIFIRPSTIAPAGYLRCNGGLVSKMAYPDLYAVIGDGSPVQLSDYGNGQPWRQQYNINTEQSGDVVGWTTGTSLLAPLTYSQAVVTKNRVYLIGGYAASGNPTSAVYTASINTDGTLGAWMVAASLPEVISYSQAVVTKNRVYLLGGYNGSAISAVYSAVINTDGTLDAWIADGSLPSGLFGSQAVVTKSRVYLLGGAITASGATSAVYTASINTDGTLGGWVIDMSLPGGLMHSHAVVTKNRVYLLGGVSSGHEVNTTYTAAINADGTLGAWTEAASLPVAVYLSQAVVTKNRVYLLGGHLGQTISSVVYSAAINVDGTLSTWSASGSSLPTANAYSQAIVTKNNVYLLGGLFGGSISAVVYTATISGGLNDYSPYYAVPVENVYNTGKPWQQHYDQNTDQVSGISSWTAGTSLPAAIKNAQAVVTKDRVYLIGGTNGTTTLTSVYTASVAADGTLGAWSAATSLPVAIANAQVCTTMDRIYLIGGDNGTTQSNKVYCAVIAADGTISSWTESAVLPETFSRGQVLATYRRVYIFAGLFNGVRGTQSYYSDIAADGTLGAWVAGGALPVSVADARLVCTKRIAYLIGGTTAAGNANTYCKVGIQPDGSLGTWTKLTTDVTTNLFGVNSGALPTNVTTLRITGKGGDGGAGTTVNLTGSGAGAITAGVTSVAITGRGADGVAVSGIELSSGRPWEQQSKITTSSQTNSLLSWTTVNSLPYAKAGGQPLVTKNKVYLIGGFASGGASGTVTQADIGADGSIASWSAGTPLPEGIAFLQVIATKNRVYVFGGQPGASSCVYTAVINTDGTLGSWVASPSTPGLLREAAVVVIKNKVYAFGGILTGDYTIVRYTTINADGTLGSWSTSASMPYAMRQPHVVVTNSRVYLIGGFADGNATSSVFYAPINADGTLGTWTTTSSLPAVAYGGSVLSTSTRVFLLGVANGSGPTTVVYSAPIDSNGVIGAWSLWSNIPQSLRGVSAFIVNNKVHIVGGVDTSNTFTASGYTAAFSGGLNDYSAYYDGSDITTSIGASTTLTTTVKNTVNESFTGSWLGHGRPWQQQNEVAFTETNTLSTWNLGTTIPEILDCHDAFVTKNRIYVIGKYTGIGTNTLHTAPVNADGSFGTWTTAGSFPTPMEKFALFTTKNRVYVNGGMDSSNMLEFLRYAPINADGTIGAWVDSTDYPFPAPYARARHKAIVLKDRVFMLPGYYGTDFAAVVRTASIYGDGSLSNWTNSVGAFPIGLADYSVVVTSSRVYIIGGVNLSGYQSTIYSATYTSAGLLNPFVAEATPFPAGNVVNALTYVNNNRAYLIGGLTGVSTVSNNLYVYSAPISSDGELGAWTIAGTAPFATSSMGAIVAVKNKVVVIGNAQGNTYNVMYATTTDGVNDYSSYYNGSSASAPARAIGYNYAHGRPWEQQNDISTTQAGLLTDWTVGAPIPAITNCHGSFVTKNRVYVVGAYGSNVPNIMHTAPINADGSLGTWTTAGTFPLPMEKFSFVVTRNRVFAMCGADMMNYNVYTHSAPINADGTVGAWVNLSSIEASIFQENLSATKAAVIGNRVHVFGGYTGPSNNWRVDSAPINSDGTLGAFSATSVLPFGRSRYSLIVTRTRAYIIGGVTDSGYTASVVSASIAADGTMGAWAADTPFPAVVADAATYVTRNRAYLICGKYGAADASTAILSAPINADGTLGTWSVVGSVPSHVSQASIFVTKNKVHLIGGTSGGANNYMTCATLDGLNDYTPYYDGREMIIDNDTRTTYTFAGGNGITAAVQSTQNLTVSGGQSPAYTYSVPTGGALGLSYQVTTTSTNSVVGNGSLNLPAAATTVSMTAKGADGVAVTGINIGSGRPWQQQSDINFTQTGDLGAWQSATPPFSSTSGVMVFVTKNRVYAAGGVYYGGSGGLSTDLVSYANINADGTLGAWTSTAVLPRQTADASAVVMNNYIYLFGGYSYNWGTGSTRYSNYVRAPINADGSIGTWSVAGSFPTVSDIGVKAVLLKDQLYLFNGHGSTIYVATVNSAGVGSWSVANISMPNPNPNTSCLVVSKNKLYLLGGYISGVNQTTVYSSVINSSGGLSSWTRETDLPRGVCYGAVTYITSNRIFLSSRASLEILTAPIAVDGTIGAWSTSASTLPADISTEAFFATSNYIYFINGYNNSAGLYSSVGYKTAITGGLNDFYQHYDSVSHTYSVTGTPSTITIAGTTYTFPGGTGVAAVNSTQTVVLPGTVAQQASYSLQSGVTASINYSYVASGNGAATTVTVNGTTYTFAGGVGAPATETTQLVTIPNTGPAYSHNVPTYGYARFEYTTVSEGSLLPEPMSDFQTYTTANTAYIFGGKTNTAQTATYTASIDYNGRLSTWTASTALPVATYAADLIAVKNKLYILGGTNTTGATPVVHYATILGGKNDYSGVYSTAQYTMYSSDFRLPDFSTIETTGSYYYIKT